MSLFKSALCFKEIEKDCERFLVQSKKTTIVDVVNILNIALANLKFHAVHATSEYICNICVVVLVPKDSNMKLFTRKSVDCAACCICHCSAYFSIPNGS